MSNTTDNKDNDLALYVHWPWCKAKCPYCDFNSKVPTQTPDHAQWTNAYVSEMKYFYELVGKRPISSIFFGGGTPSTMAAETVGRIIETASDLWGLQDNVEITIEANPTSVEVAALKDFAKAGVNRVSIGVQSLNDENLKFLGREHSGRDAVHALETAASIFPRFNFDLIYALPGQSVGEWQNELLKAITLGADHMSLYQLSIEPGTAFFKQNVSPADEDSAATMFEITQEIMGANKMPAYEISNHARPGFESRHNMVYWQGGEYVGIGPGAHGRIGLRAARTALHQIADPARWLARVATDGHGTAKTKAIETRQSIEERIMTGLRITNGIGRKGFETDFKQTLESALNPEQLAHLTQLNLIEIDEAGIRATDDGRIKLNAIIERLLE